VTAILTIPEWNAAWDAVFDRDLGNDEAMAALAAEDKLKQHDAAMRMEIAELEKQNTSLQKMVEDGIRQMQAATARLDALMVAMPDKRPIGWGGGL